MKDPSKITACVFDHGLFLPLAHRLAKKFDRVLYYTPADKAYTTLNDKIVGDGFSDVERCNDFWKIKRDIDLFVFPDIQHSGLQLELESQGFPVWGGRDGDSLELDREKFHDLLGKVGLEVPKFERVVGLTALRKYLQKRENVYIKISFYRGSMETGKFRNMDMDEGLLDQWAVRFGPAKELMPFLCFDEIETDLEIGADLYCVDGKFPSLMLNGIERKDKSYISAVTPREEMPKQVQETLEAFAPLLGEYRYRNQLSLEIRVQGDKFFFIDITCRGGLPSSSSQYALWGNFPEIVWYGAHGEIVDPIPTAQFGAECLMSMKSQKDSWGKTRIPKELKDHMHCMTCCEIEGAICFPPDETTNEAIGWLNATGKSLEEVVENIKGNADKLPDGVDADTDALVDVLDEIHKMKAEKIPFTDEKIPEPESALNIEK